MIHRIFILISAILTAMLAAGCDERSRTPEDPTRLVVSSRLYSQPGEQQFLLDVVIPDFEKQNDCIIMFEIIDDEPMLRRARFQKESGRVTTDIIIAHSGRMQQWIEEGYVQPLPTGSWPDRTFSQAFTSKVTRDGVTYFAPVGGDVYLTLINRKAMPYLPPGADVQNLTWAEYVAWSKAIAVGEGQGKVAITGVPQKSLIYMVGGAVLAHGGGFPDIDSPGALDAWTTLSGLHDALAPGIDRYDNVSVPMKNGEAWLTVAHMVRCGEAYRSAPEDFILAPAPSGPAGIGSIAATSGYALVNGAQNPDLAVKFIEFMTRPDIAIDVARGTGGFIPPIDEALEFLGDSLQDEIIAKGLYVLAEGVVSGIPGSEYESWGAVKQVYDDAFQEIVIRRGAADPVYLAEAQARLDSLRKQAGAK